jgi:hypothetical protein
MTLLGEYNCETEVFVACPASELANSKRFKKAYKALYPNDKFHLIYHKGCLHSHSNEPFIQRTYHIAQNDVYILTSSDVQTVNAVGIEAINGVSFYKVSKDCAYCLKTTSYGKYLEIDKDRFIIQELQKKYSISDDFLWDLERQGRNMQLLQVRGAYDSESEEEEWTL